MATNPFSGAGLGQMGQDTSFSAGGSQEDGIGRFLAMYGLEKAGVVDFLNKSLQPTGLGINSKGKLGTAVPPQQSAPVGTVVPNAASPILPAAPETKPHLDGFNYLEDARK